MYTDYLVLILMKMKVIDKYGSLVTSSVDGAWTLLGTLFITIPNSDF